MNQKRVSHDYTMDEPYTYAKKPRDLYCGVYAVEARKLGGRELYWEGETKLPNYLTYFTTESATQSNLRILIAIISTKTPLN